MNRILVWLGTMVWGALVFMVVFYMTFPSDAVGRRIAWEVDHATKGRYAVALRDVAPWWAGLSAKEVIVSAVAGPRAENAGEAVPFFFADSLSARVGLFSLLGDARNVFVKSRLGEGRVDAFARVAQGERGVSVRALELEADQLSVTDIMAAAMRGAAGGVVAEGAIDVDLDLRMRDGLNQAKGGAVVHGTNVAIKSVSSSMTGEIPLDANIDEIDFDLHIDEGKAEFDKGTLRSSIADADIEGDIELNDRVGRSRLRLDVTLGLGDWSGTPLEPFRGMATGFLKAAEWADGRYHYQVNSSIDRLDAGDFRPARERKGRAPTADRGAARDLPARPSRLDRARPEPASRRPDPGARRPTIRRDAGERPGRGRFTRDRRDDEDEELDDEELEDEELEDEELEEDVEEGGEDEPFDEIDRDY